MRLRRHVFNNPGNFTICCIVDIQGFAQHIYGVEISFCCCFIDHNGIGFIQSSQSVAGNHRYGKHLEKSRIGIYRILILNILIILFDQYVPEIPEARKLYNLRMGPAGPDSPPT